MTPSATRAVVLVADDEPSMLSLIAQHVRTLGHTVHLAHDGEEAWSQIQTQRPDLVLLDVMMPAMSGWEVCRKIREDRSLGKTAVIMITGIGERLNEMTSPLFGADHYLDKPFELSDLDNAIRDALVKRGGGVPAGKPASVAPKAAPAAKKKPVAKKAAAKPVAKKAAAKPAAKKAPAKKAAAKPVKKAVKKAVAKKAAKPIAKKAAKPVAKKAAPKKKAARPAKKKR